MVLILESATDHLYEIHNQLKALMQMKSIRDGKEFSIYQLAKAINMPHSIIVKLLHSDPNKRVVNPRIDTLTKIVDFFKSDGFPITIDGLILGKGEFDIDSVLINQNHQRHSIEFFSLNNVHENLGKIDVNIARQSEGLIALLSDTEIKPFFKSGSVFIIDTKISLKDKNLVAVRTENTPEVQIKRFIEKNKASYLSSLTESETTKFSSALYHILGVVVQVNAIT